MELGLDDESRQAVTCVEVGPEGERTDKDQYVSDWQTVIRPRVADDPLLRKVRDDEGLDPDEEDELARRLNRPERYFNEKNLRRAYRDPGGTLSEFIRAALGRLRIRSGRRRSRRRSGPGWSPARSLPAKPAISACERIAASPPGASTSTTSSSRSSRSSMPSARGSSCSGKGDSTGRRRAVACRCPHLWPTL